MSIRQMEKLRLLKVFPRSHGDSGAGLLAKDEVRNLICYT